MADKLSWNPPKWKSYSFDGTNFEVELETGRIFKGKINRLKNGSVDINTLKHYINDLWIKGKTEDRPCDGYPSHPPRFGAQDRWRSTEGGDR